MAFDMVTMTAIVAILALLYFYVRSRYRYFPDKPYLHLKPTFLLGRSGPLMLCRRDMIEHVEILYKSLSDAKIIGMYDQLTPSLIVRDPKCVKQIGVKDFDFLSDHTPFVKKEGDTLVSILVDTAGFDFVSTALRFLTYELMLVSIYYLLKSFTFERCDKTQVPLRLKSNLAALVAEKGIWIRFNPRELSN